MTSHHIEGLHFHDHASELSAARSARRVLRRLADHRLISHLERRVGGIRAGSAGYVWTISKLGARLLEEQGRPGRVKHEPSQRLLDHSLAIADIHLVLVQAGRAGQFELLTVELEPDSWRRYFGLGGEQRLIRPDLAIVTAQGDFEDHWYLEIDLGTEHPPTVVRKCQSYLDYLRSGVEQERLGLFPRVLWVVLDEERADRLQQAFEDAHLDHDLFRAIVTSRLVGQLRGGAS